MVLLQFVTLTAFLLVAPATQKSKRAISSKDPCATAMTQADLNECWAQQYKKADAHLNSIYKTLLELMKNDLVRDGKLNNADMVKFDETALLDLKRTERLWIRYRDSACKQQIGSGSMAPMTGAICLMDVTNDRIREIKDAYETPDRKLE
ncbi:MAG TPA: lysozyme inhibitor LprI family protein [Candidatus Acidoferrales bacterium]|nr:lysozyme inhibitor LprI family protein [Candidatus Acidoferrales bacterium]